MKFNPHDYQAVAIKFIEEHPQAALLLTMGLGKTVITLTALNDLLLDSFEVARVLVIAPLRVARDTWPTELEKWDHLKLLKCAVAVGTEAERRAAIAEDAPITIINRENIPWLVENIEWRWDMVVIDELSSFKSHSSKRFKELLKVRPFIKRIVGLTGTPSPNGLMDLWAEYRLLDLGVRLGRFITPFRNMYFRPDKQSGYVVFSYKPVKGAEEAIYKKISDMTLSMKACDHLKMPTLLTPAYMVHLDAGEMQEYDRLKRTYVLSEQNVTAQNAASLAGKLCQMANGALYDDDGKTIEFHSRKLDALEDLIEASNGNPVLVAYWFKHDHERIMKRFPQARDLKTSQDLKDWNAGKIAIALIHPASAGHGLNLQAGGNVLIWFGLTWSLELYQQTNARLWRQGQKASTVVVQHIVAEGTIDERILQALSHKELTQDALMSAVKAQLD